MKFLALREIVRPWRMLIVAPMYYVFAMMPAGLLGMLPLGLRYDPLLAHCLALFGPVTLGAFFSGIFGDVQHLPFVWNLPRARSWLMAWHAAAFVVLAAVLAALARLYVPPMPWPGGIGLSLLGLTIAGACEPVRFEVDFRRGSVANVVLIAAGIAIALFSMQAVAWVRLHPLAVAGCGIGMALRYFFVQYDRERMRALALIPWTSDASAFGSREATARNARRKLALARAKAEQKAERLAQGAPKAGSDDEEAGLWEQQVLANPSEAYSEFVLSSVKHRKPGLPKWRMRTPLLCALAAGSALLGGGVRLYGVDPARPHQDDLLVNMLLVGAVAAFCAIAGLYNLVPQNYSEPISRRERLRRSRALLRSQWEINLPTVVLLGLAYECGAAWAGGRVWAFDSAQFYSLLLLDVGWLPMLVWLGLQAALSRNAILKRLFFFLATAGAGGAGVLFRLIHLAPPGPWELAAAAAVGGCFHTLSELRLKRFFLRQDFVLRPA